MNTVRIYEDNLILVHITKAESLTEGHFHLKVGPWSPVEL